MSSSIPKLAAPWQVHPPQTHPFNCPSAEVHPGLLRCPCSKNLDVPPNVDLIPAMTLTSGLRDDVVYLKHQAPLAKRSSKFR